MLLDCCEWWAGGKTEWEFNLVARRKYLGACRRLSYSNHTQSSTYCIDSESIQVVFWLAAAMLSIYMLASVPVIYSERSLASLSISSMMRSRIPLIIMSSMPGSVAAIFPFLDNAEHTVSGAPFWTLRSTRTTGDRIDSCTATHNLAAMCIWMSERSPNNQECLLRFQKDTIRMGLLLT
jgi:hypothetical protein